MKFRTTTNVPALKEQFTIRSSCKQTANNIAHDFAETIDFAGINAGMHFLKCIQPAIAIIINGDKTQINLSPIIE